MQRFAPVILFVLTVALGGLLQAAPVHADDAKNGDAQADEPKAGQAKAPIRGGPNDKDALWWDDPKIVKALSLTDEQRKKMGDVLDTYRKEVPQDRKLGDFHESLVQGNWKDARSESEKIAKAAETAVRIRGILKIDVLSLLEDEQREKLVDRYPRLIYQPWTRAMRGASPR